MSMKILFVGFFYNPEKESEYLRHSNVGLSVASNLYQWNVITGLQANGLDVGAIGYIPYGNYPSLSDVLFCHDEEYVYKNIKVKQLGFINYYVIKHKIREWKIRKYVRQWVEKNKHDDCAIIFYDLQSTFLRIIDWVKLYKNVRTCLIVPDLFGKLRSDNGIRGIKRWIMNYLSSNQQKLFADSYIFLTEEMNNVMNVQHKPYIVVDGIVDDDKECDICVPQKRVLMYAGNLSTQFNILNLLQAFEAEKHNNLELWFCGKGSSEERILEASKRDKRIKYLGFMSKSELNEIEKNVCFYINPRLNNGLYTKYSFPSKNLEYLLAGKPVIVYKLDGMSDDYDDIFLYLSEKDEISLSKMFKRLSEMKDEEIRNIALRSINFVKKHNGKKHQCKKIIKLLEGLFNGTE